MAKITVIITGDKELDRMLFALEKKTARKLHRTAARTAAKMILVDAKAAAPVDSGAYRRSLTVRATRRSRKGIGYRVTQKELKSRDTGKKTKVFYGAFLELGYRAVGRPRGLTNSQRKQRVEQARKIPGRWLMKAAGDRNERAAVQLYQDELRKLLAAEA